MKMSLPDGVSETTKKIMLNALNDYKIEYEVNLPNGDKKRFNSAFANNKYLESDLFSDHFSSSERIETAFVDMEEYAKLHMQSVLTMWLVNQNQNYFKKFSFSSKKISYDYVARAQESITTKIALFKKISTIVVLSIYNEKKPKASNIAQAVAINKLLDALDILDELPINSLVMQYIAFLRSCHESIIFQTKDNASELLADGISKQYLINRLSNLVSDTEDYEKVGNYVSERILSSDSRLLA